MLPTQLAVKLSLAGYIGHYVDCRQGNITSHEYICLETTLQGRRKRLFRGHNWILLSHRP